MILKVRELKKLMNDAYKGCGLYIGRTSGQFIIEGGWWSFWVYKSALPKEIKGEIIRLSGEYPEVGKGYKCFKNEDPQYELCPTHDPYDRWERAIHVVEKSNTYVQICDNMYNLIESTAGVQLVDKRIMDMVTQPDGIARSAGECDCGDPQTDGVMILWENNVSIFAAAIREPETDELEKMMGAVTGCLY